MHACDLIVGALGATLPAGGELRFLGFAALRAAPRGTQSFRWAFTVLVAFDDCACKRYIGVFEDPYRGQERRRFEGVTKQPLTANLGFDALRLKE
jgi:hypothetical protein